MLLIPTVLPLLTVPLIPLAAAPLAGFAGLAGLAGLAAIPPLPEALSRFQSSLLCILQERIDPCPTLRQQLQTAIAEAPPLSPKEGGFIRTGFHARLDQVRELTKGGVDYAFDAIGVQRTIEQILGLPPMNQFDASATPMFDCFTHKPDFAPFSAAESNVALDGLNAETNAIDDAILRSDAVASSKMNFRELDRAPEDVLNRILWRSVHGSKTPYPEWAVDFNPSDDDD